MKSTIDHGGQAYPGPSFTSNGIPNGHDMGMSLRDWFAGQALAAMGTWCPDADYGPVNWDDKTFVARLRAEYAYKAADAMIAARKGGAA